MFGEIVGFGVIIYFIVFGLMRPYSYNSFVARALSKLYIVKGNEFGD